jgi:hypothetical protein
MKRLYKIIGLIIITMIMIFSVISATINLFLNKKYVVDQIKYTERKQGLEGIQKVITEDYISTIYLNIFFIAMIIGFATIIIFQMKRNN